MSTAPESTLPISETSPDRIDPSLHEQEFRGSRGLEYIKASEAEIRLALAYVERAKNDQNVLDLRQKSLENGDRETLLHSDGVALLAVVIANRLGCNKKELDYVATAGLVHDVGKAHDPEIQALVLDPRKFTDEEHKKLQRHPYLSAEKIAATEGWPSEKKRVVHDLALSHHAEKKTRRYGERPEDYRILSVAHAMADLVDSLSTPRGYRPYALEKPEMSRIIHEEMDLDPALIRQALGENRRFDRSAARQMGEKALANLQ